MLAVACVVTAPGGWIPIVTARADTGAPQRTMVTVPPAAVNPAPTPDEGLPNRDPHGPPDVEKHIRWLESTKQRDWFQRPAAIVTALHLASDAIVADLGCGPGYLTRRLAHAVPEGLVYAVDVEPRQIYRLHDYLLEEKVFNVIPVLSSLVDPHLPPGQVDMIVILDTYHHFDDRDQYLQTLTRALAPGGRIAIIDYYKRKLPIGPPIDHKMARTEVLEEFARAGYTLLEEPDVLEYQYFLLFGRAGDQQGPPPTGRTDPAATRDPSTIGGVAAARASRVGTRLRRDSLVSRVRNSSPNSAVLVGARGVAPPRNTVSIPASARLASPDDPSLI
jgi:SAM-dependent methyltransferase